MGVHKQMIKWHDLIEDPDDLPNGTYGIDLHVMLQYDNSEPYLACREACYLKEIGFVMYDTTWIYDPVTKSLVSNVQQEVISSKKSNHNLRVIAWCEDVKPYVRKEY